MYGSSPALLSRRSYHPSTKSFPCSFETLVSQRIETLFRKIRLILYSEEALWQITLSIMKGCFKSKPKTPADIVRQTRELLVHLASNADRESKREEKVRLVVFSDNTIYHLFLLYFPAIQARKNFYLVLIKKAIWLSSFFCFVVFWAEMSDVYIV